MLKKFQCNTGNFNHLRLNRLCFTQNLIVFILKENVSYSPVKVFFIVLCLREHTVIFNSNTDFKI